MGFLWFVCLVSCCRFLINIGKDYQNRHGSNIGAKVFLTVVGILNAARNSFSFFLLLIVCMGYGVVKHTLGRTMIYVRWLAAAHFLFGLVYSVTSLVITPETAGKLPSFVSRSVLGSLTNLQVPSFSSSCYPLPVP